MTGFLHQYGGEIGTLTLEHLWLTGAAMLFAAAIAIPVGIWLTRAPGAQSRARRRQHPPDHPSLAMFGFLLPLPWLGDRAARIAIVALTAYALLPILRNTYAGIRTIDPAVTEVARALASPTGSCLPKSNCLFPRPSFWRGSGLRRHLRRHRTIAAAVGAGGLGELIFRGVASVDNRLVLAGAIPPHCSPGRRRRSRLIERGFRTSAHLDRAP